MSDNPRLNPIILIVPFVAAAGTNPTLPILRSDLGGQVLDKYTTLGVMAAITAADATAATLAVKVGAQANGLTLSTATTGGGGVGNIAAGGAANFKSGGTAPAEVAKRQWPRGTLTDVAIVKTELSTGTGIPAGSVVTAPIIQSAYDPLS